MENYRILLTEEQIQKRVKELGEQITKDYKDKHPLFICMLKGAIVFFSDIIRNVKIPVEMDFARLSSYRNGTVSGEMQMINDITAEVKGKDVIIVEDIVDSGKTLSYFCELLKKKEPASIKICAFSDKKERREVDIEADYVGFDIPNVFVIGYGLDYAEKYRELPFLAEVLDPSKI
ncbi:MAG: hypoxanthine phosphoribosyltransferase [Clostridia bacterium]|nr:hypoxanthine phosphoribosyltransferase [Clostridia bacterium]